MQDTNTTERIKLLAQKWQTGNISDDEKIEFNNWYNGFDDTFLEETSAETVSDLKERLYHNIAQKENIPAQRVRQLMPWQRIAAAAAVLLMLSIAGWFVWHKPSVEQIAQNIPAGGNRAILTLVNGQRIVLTSAKNGVLAQQGTITISKTADGKVVYNTAGGVVSAKNTDNALAYNTISTPRGGQYWVVLADGSRVLLNAASSLKYPVTFKGTERLVELTGEAYFEVVHNAASPFRVKTAGQLIEDVGTHFNVNAYTDEPDTKTTLLEGGVKVTSLTTAATKLLVPGQQAVLDSHSFTVQKANIEQALAWKDGLFVFDHTDLHSLMRQVSRWYNIDVAYEGDVKNDQFFGEVERKYSLAEVVKVLKLGGLHFRIEEHVTEAKETKTLIVMP
jgi:ferric-dicitrate binding protein FerR (iron transport regulator)